MNNRVFGAGKKRKNLINGSYNVAMMILTPTPCLRWENESRWPGFMSKFVTVGIVLL